MDQYLELLDRAVQRQQRTLHLSLAGLALLIAFAEQRGDSVVALGIYGFVVFAAIGLLGLWIGEAGRIEDVVLEAKQQQPESRGRKGHFKLFEGELRRTRSLLFWAWVGLEGAAFFAAVLGWHELHLEEATAGPKPNFDLRWRVGFLLPSLGLLLWGIRLFIRGRRELSSALTGKSGVDHK